MGPFARGFSPLTDSLDFILAACDLEGNFLALKSYQYTDLLSCMLLDAWVLFSLSGIPPLTVALEQMVDPNVHVLLLGIYAENVHLESAHCMGSSLD